jgi:hypothetical protein
MKEWNIVSAHVQIGGSQTWGPIPDTAALLANAITRVADGDIFGSIENVRHKHSIGKRKSPCRALCSHSRKLILARSVHREDEQ